MSRFMLRAASLCVIGLLLSANPLLANPWEIDSFAWAENCGRFTVAPGGGENLVDPGIGNDYLIHVTIYGCEGNPVVGLPATDLWLRHDDLATCPGQFSQADAPTDAAGHSTFSGTIFAGLVGDASAGVDCDEAYLYVYALGIILNDANPVCVATDSPDLNGDFRVSIPDFALFAADYNCYYDGLPCDPCHDFSENGRTDLPDFAIFAEYLNASVCP